MSRDNEHNADPNADRDAEPTATRFLQETVQLRASITMLAAEPHLTSRRDISRAYYGAFHAALAILQELAAESPGSGKAHNLVAQYLLAAKHPTASTAARIIHRRDAARSSLRSLSPGSAALHRGLDSDAAIAAYSSLALACIPARRASEGRGWHNAAVLHSQPALER